MRHLMLINVSAKEYEAGKPPPPALEAAMGELMGTWGSKIVSAEGLRPSSEGARLRIGNGKLTVTDGPFTEAKEIVGGFFVLQTDTREEVMQMTKDFLKLHEKVLGKSFEIACEVRKLES